MYINPSDRFISNILQALTMPENWMFGLVQWSFLFSRLGVPCGTKPTLPTALNTLNTSSALTSGWQRILAAK